MEFDQLILNALAGAVLFGVVNGHALDDPIDPVDLILGEYAFFGEGLDRENSHREPCRLTFMRFGTAADDLPKPLELLQIDGGANLGLNIRQQDFGSMIGQLQNVVLSFEQHESSHAAETGNQACNQRQGRH